MTRGIAALGNSTRIGHWRTAELQPAMLINSLISGVLVFGVGIMLVLAFAALVFSGRLGGQLSEGLGFALLGSAVVCGVIALLTSYPGSIAIAQDAPAVLLAVMATNVIASLPPGYTQAQEFASVVLTLTLAAAVTGLEFLLLGVFKLARLVRFLPFPVMGGFLAGTGWLLATGGVSVMVGGASLMDLVQPAVALHWVPGVLLGVAMLVIVSRVNSTLALPILSGLAILGFYVVVGRSGIPQAQVEAQGWLLGPFPSGRLWESTSSPGMVLRDVQWPVVLAQVPNMVPLTVISVIALLLNASGLELLVKRDIDLNRELRAAGVANLAQCLTGGLVGYPAISLSTLNYTTSGGRRLPGLVTAALFGATALFGVGLLSLVPKLVLGALLVFLGLSLLREWIYRAWFTFARIDFLVIALIAGIVAARGFLDGIAAGLAMAVIVFVVSSSRTNVVKHALSGADYWSRVTRDPQRQAIVRAHGSELYVLELQGVIFFGTANTLYERLRERASHADVPPPRFVVLDFAHVTGLDSTGLLSFRKMRQFADERGMTLVLTGLSGGVRARFTGSGFGQDPGAVRMFGDLDHGLEWCENELIVAHGGDDHMVGPDGHAGLLGQLHQIFRPGTPVERLIKQLQKKQVAAGEHLIHQGDDPDLLFFIESGQVTAQLETPGQDPVRLETMRGGHVVGELGFYLGGKRTAAVLADEPSTVYALSRQALARLENEDPEMASILHRAIVHLLAQRVVHLIRSIEALQR